MTESTPQPGASQTFQLLVAAKHGHRASFDALCQHLEPTVYAWLRLRLRGSPTAATDADDLFQEVWLCTWRNLHAFDPSLGRFRSWVLGIAVNALRTHRRRAAAQPQPLQRAAASNASDAEFTDVPAAPATSVCSRMARDEEVAAFVDYAETLGADERQLLLYRGFEEREFAEIAQRMALPVTTVEKRWQRLSKRIHDSGLAARIDLHDGSASDRNSA